MCISENPVAHARICVHWSMSGCTSVGIWCASACLRVRLCACLWTRRSWTPILVFLGQTSQGLPLTPNTAHLLPRFLPRLPTPTALVPLFAWRPFPLGGLGQQPICGRSHFRQHIRSGIDKRLCLKGWAMGPRRYGAEQRTALETELRLRAVPAGRGKCRRLPYHCWGVATVPGPVGIGIGGRVFGPCSEVDAKREHNPLPLARRLRVAQ